MTAKNNTLSTPRTFKEGLEDLMRDAAMARPHPGKVTSLPPKAIGFATSVFQQRAFDGVVQDHKDHINALKDAIKNTPGHRVEPIVVWWSGREWKVLDGHHRGLGRAGSHEMEQTAVQGSRQ